MFSLELFTQNIFIPGPSDCRLRIKLNLGYMIHTALLLALGHA